MSTIHRWLRDLQSGFLPVTCCLCGFNGARKGLDLCEVCTRLLPTNHILSCPPIFSRALIPFEYAYPIDHFVRALKFRGERLYARVLGELLADAQRRSDAPLPRSIVAVPLHTKRYRERGFNQAHEIARYAAASLGLPVDAGCIERTRFTAEQSGLPPAARRRNMRGAFMMSRPSRAGHVALVDDVLTTGSTATEAAVALARAGADTIEIWCAARAWPSRAIPIHSSEV